MSLARTTFFLLTLAAPALAQDPLTQQALKRIERAEQALTTLQAGDTRGIQSVIADLNWAQKRLGGVYDKNDAHYQKAVERHTAAVQKANALATAQPGGGSGPAFDLAKLQQLQKEIDAAQHNFDIVPQKLWQDAARQRGTQRDLDKLAERLAAFPKEAAQVAEVAAKLSTLQQKFAAATGRAASDQAGAGDVDQQVEQLMQRYTGSNLPQLPEQPYSPERVEAYLRLVKQLREVELPRDLAIAERATQNTAANAQRSSSLLHTLRNDWPRRLAEHDVQLAGQVALAAKLGAEFAGWVLATDADDRDQVANRILSRGAFDANVTRLLEAQQAVEVAALHDRLVGPPPVAEGEQPVDRKAQQRQVAEALTHLKKLAVSTLDAVRMPAAASTDAELLAIAEKTLRVKDYGVGEWQRLVINMDKRHRERTEGWIRPGTVTTTVSVYKYEWDEFQVTTAEQVGDETWLFFNLLKYYQSGDPTTPVGRWILSKRFESTRILPENVDK